MADVTLSSILSSGFPYRKQAIITSSQTWTLPSTAAPSVDYDIIAGGGGGYTTTGSTSSGGGGGGGGRRKGTIMLVPGTGYPVVVGSAGIAGATSGLSTAGGQSSFAGISVNGGGPGTQSAGGASGLGISVDYAISVRGAVGNRAGYSGYDGFCSGGGGGPSNSSTPVPGGDGAGDGSFNADASSATRPGCGGGGAGQSTAGTVYKGGDGYRGEVRITYWDSVP